jgi:SAM-dependent methyltransferase
VQANIGKCIKLIGEIGRDSKMKKDQVVSKEIIRKTIKIYDNIEIAEKHYKGEFRESRHRTLRHNKEFEFVRNFVSNLSYERSLALDIGCDGGRYTEMLTKFGFDTFGMDTAICGLKFAKLKNNEVSYVNGSATNLPFKNNNFELILCIELLHHFDDYFLEVVLSEISRIVKPGGVLIIDIRNSLNPVMRYSYRKRDGSYYPLKTRSIFNIKKILKKYDLNIIHKDNLFFVSPFSPYILLYCKKLKHKPII